MRQSRAMSLIESAANVVVGFVVATLANVMILPAYGHDVVIFDAFSMGVWFTLISLVRSYALRRLFCHWSSR